MNGERKGGERLTEERGEMGIGGKGERENEKEEDGTDNVEITFLSSFSWFPTSQLKQV